MRPSFSRHVWAALSPVALAVLALAGCADERASGGSARQEDDVTVDTRTPQARAQYDADLAFVRSYVPRCAPSPGSEGRPRALVTGFGRFLSIRDNATGRIVSTLVPEARYPETTAPPAGQVDPPDAQLSVATTTIDLPNAGKVEVCGMILPVYWDLAAILIAREMEAFGPSFVMMSGVAGPKQPLWIELGSANRAAAQTDGSGRLQPAPPPGATVAPLVEDAPPEEQARPNFLSWEPVARAAEGAIARNAGVLGTTLPGVRLAGFPRASSTYLCNNVTYVTGYLMDHVGTTVNLLRANTPRPGEREVDQVPVTMTRDLKDVPRVFLHWPSAMATMGHEAGADVMRAILDAQLTAAAAGTPPTRGTNDIADPAMPGGAFF